MKLYKVTLIIFLFVLSLNAKENYKEINIANVMAKGSTNIESTYGISAKFGKYLKEDIRIYFDISAVEWENSDIKSLGFNIDHILGTYSNDDFYYGINIDRYKLKTQLTNNNEIYDNAFGVKLGFIKKDFIKNNNLNLGMTYKILNAKTYNPENKFTHKIDTLFMIYAGLEF